MFPSYEGYRPILDLAEDDIRGIQALYGPPEVRYQYTGTIQTSGGKISVDRHCTDLRR